MPQITNPILPGFNPDPSILRVGDDYYIACSTFEWFPGVQIHHSRDLVHWELLAHPLERVSQLDMAGNPNSGGIWAPCLSYADGLFWLIYTDVKWLGGLWKDTHNYLVTATDIRGTWSEPVFLNSSGFDPSLFHDDDGRKWLVNMQWEYRKGRNRFAGTLLQEYSPAEQRLVGPIENIFLGSPLGVTEGPHLYKRDGWYYLLTAEGGTGANHAVTMARSRSLRGPYEIDPQNPVLTSRGKPELLLQKAGHADIVETQTGEWYMVHLCSRPIPGKNRSILGRETAIQQVKWTEDGWLRLSAGGNSPLVQVPAPQLPAAPLPPVSNPGRDDFAAPTLGIHWSTLRIPLGEDTLSLQERPGYLRLRGRESLTSQYTQALVARRQQAFRYTATTCLEFAPETFQQMAGLVCYYDTEGFFYLRVSHDEELGTCLGIISRIGKENIFTEPLETDISIADWPRVYLRATVDVDVLQFSYSPDGETWQNIGEEFDASTLSDEYAREGFRFTGAFVGICCQDMSGRRKEADFDWFEYTER